MKRFLIVLTLIAVAAYPSLAQGLKGAHMPPEILGRLVYVKGDNDQARWKTFVDVQPRLIGMTFEEVDKALCGKAKHRAMSEVKYGLTQEPVKIGESESCLHVKVFLRNGLAWKYSVEASSQ